MQGWDLVYFTGLLVVCSIVGTLLFVSRDWKKKLKKIEHLTKTNGSLRNERLFLKQPADKIKATLEEQWKVNLSNHQKKNEQRIADLEKAHQDTLEKLNQQHAAEVNEWRKTIASLKATNKDLEQQSTSQQDTITELTTDLEKQDVIHSQQEQQIRSLERTKEIGKDQLEKLNCRRERELEREKERFEHLDERHNTLKQEMDTLQKKVDSCRNFTTLCIALAAFYDPDRMEIEVLKDRTYKLVRNISLPHRDPGFVDDMVGPSVEIIRVPETVDLFNPMGQLVREPKTQRLLECYTGPDEFTLWTAFASALRGLEKGVPSNPLPATLTDQELVEIKETMTYKEIAKETGLPEGTVKRRISQYRKELRTRDEPSKNASEPKTERKT